jgi:hypothetical protein
MASAFGLDKGVSLADMEHGLGRKLDINYFLNGGTVHYTRVKRIYSRRLVMENNTLISAYLFE